MIEHPDFFLKNLAVRFTNCTKEKHSLGHLFNALNVKEVWENSEEEEVTETSGYKEIVQCLERLTINVSLDSNFEWVLGRMESLRVLSLTIVDDTSLIAALPELDLTKFTLRKAVVYGREIQLFLSKFRHIEELRVSCVSLRD